MSELPYLGAAMMLYALLTFTSYLARYSPEYSFPAIRICSVYLVLVAPSFGAPFVARLRSGAPAKTASVHIAVAVLAICFVAFRTNDLDISGLRAQIAALNSRHWQPALDLNWQTYLNTADTLMPDAASKTIWATYSGLFGIITSVSSIHRRTTSFMCLVRSAGKNICAAFGRLNQLMSRHCLRDARLFGRNGCTIPSGISIRNCF